MLRFVFYFDFEVLQAYFLHRESLVWLQKRVSYDWKLFNRAVLRVFSKSDKVLLKMDEAPFQCSGFY